MDESYARISKAGRILCGRSGEDGRFTCDEPVADTVTLRRGNGVAERRLVPLPGWVLDKKGVWQKSAQVEDRRAHGLASPRLPPSKRTYPDLPALVRCPKCRAVQWLEAARLNVAPRPNASERPSSFTAWGGPRRTAR